MIYEFKITYDGLDNQHQIDLGDLAESLKGFDRILSVVGHFEQTLKYAPKKTVHTVNVLASAAESNCFSMKTIIEFACQYGLFSGAGTALIGAIMALLFSRHRKDQKEMKHLSEALNKAIEQLASKDNQATIDHAFDTINRMVDALTPAAKQAMTPVGQSCKTITIKTPDGEINQTYDISNKEALQAIEDTKISEPKQFTLQIKELDLITSSAKVVIAGDEDENRIKANIQDPCLKRPENPYSGALDRQTLLTVTAKAETKEGEIIRIYISDAKSE